MCHTQQLDPTIANQTQQEPIAPGQGPVTDALAAGGVTQATGPAQGAVKDTKFAKLLKVVTPIVQGGLIGGFGGNWRVPGSGNAAAQNFFQQRAQLALQKRYLANQTQQQAFLNALRASEMERNNFYEDYLRARTAEQEHAASAPYKGSSADEKWRPSTEYPGYLINDQGQLKQIMAPTDAQHPSAVPMGPPESVVDREKKAKQPIPKAEVTTDAKGISTTRYRDMNPESPTYRQLIDMPNEATRAPKPSTNEREGTQITGKDKADIERVAEAALQASGNDPDKAAAAITANKSIPNKFKSYARDRAREIARKTKKGGFNFGSVNLQHVGPTE
jgi:hypothetical protein